MIRENVKINYPFVAVCTSKREKMPVGWAVYKYTKQGVYLDKTKRAKAYFGVSTHFANSMVNIRKWYGINLPTSGWSDKTQVKTKQFTTMEDFLINLKSLINL